MSPSGKALIRDRDNHFGTMSATMTAAVEDLPTANSFAIHSKPSWSHPSASAVELNNASENIEMKDRTVTPKPGTATTHFTDSVSKTNAHRVRARMQFISLCYSLFLAGWNDGTTGPLLPRIQEVYHVRPLACVLRK